MTDQTLKNVIDQQQETINTALTAVQVAERRGWGMFILGIIIGWLWRTYARL